MAQGRERVDSNRIAKMVGVSRSTVSKVINNYPDISEETRRRVEAAVEKYRYFPVHSAQTLAGKLTGTIGFFFVNPGNITSDFLINLMVSSIIEAAAARQHHVLSYIIGSLQSPEAQRAVHDVIYRRRVDAAIFLGTRNNESTVEELIADGFVVGVFDQKLPGRSEPNRITVNFDNAAAAVAITDHLVQLGHTRVALLRGDTLKHAGAERDRAFRLALERSGISVPDRWVLDGEFDRGVAHESVAALLRNGDEAPTAIISANDNMAFGAIDAIQQAGLRVPEDISVTGIDGHPLAGYFAPAVTTVAFDFHRMMTTLVERVAESSAKEAHSEGSIDETMAGRFVPGASTAQPRQTHP